MFGYLVNSSGNYNAPFIPMAVLLLIGALLWLRIDATQELILAASAIQPRSAQK
jgi:MFS transporter, ACS family, glucarate transporter